LFGDILTSDGDEGLATGDLRRATGDLPRGLRLVLREIANLDLLNRTMLSLPKHFTKLICQSIFLAKPKPFS